MKLGGPLRIPNQTSEVCLAFLTVGNVAEKQSMVTDVTWAQVEGGRVKRFLRTTLSLDKVQSVYNDIAQNQKEGKGSRFIISGNQGEFEANDVFVDQAPDPNNTLYSKN